MHNLTKNLRRRAAFVIVVFYAFCVLAPTVTLAFSDNSTALHCLTVTSATANIGAKGGAARSHGGKATHQHEQYGAPDDHSGKDGKSNAGSCCGLFCVSAIAHDPGLTFGRFAPAMTAVSGVVTGLIGQAPSPLHRPPIA